MVGSLYFAPKLRLPMAVVNGAADTRHGAGLALTSLPKCDQTTPAMALGIAKHVWSVGELLNAVLAVAPIQPIETAPARRRRFRIIEGIRAYELERTVVRFPRVMVFREIMQDIDKYTAMPFLVKDMRIDFKKHLKQADDGPYYIHVLRTVSAEIENLKLENLNLASEKQHSLDEYAKMQAVIQKRLNEATDNPRHFEKVQWFARYWQRCVPDGVPTFTPIIGPAMDIVTWRSGSPASDRR